MNTFTSTVFVLAILYSLCIGTLEVVISATLQIPSDCLAQELQTRSTPGTVTIGIWLIVDGLMCLSYALTKFVKRYPELTCTCQECTQGDEEEVEEQQEEEQKQEQKQEREQEQEEKTAGNFMMSSIDENAVRADRSTTRELRAPHTAVTSVLAPRKHRGDVPYARNSPHLNRRISSKSRAGGFWPSSIYDNFFPWIDLFAEVTLVFRFAWAITGTLLLWECVQSKQMGTIFLMGIVQTFIICAIRFLQLARF